jgi:hypothetical protein
MRDGTQLWYDGTRDEGKEDIEFSFTLVRQASERLRRRSDPNLTKSFCNTSSIFITAQAFVQNILTILSNTVAISTRTSSL